MNDMFLLAFMFPAYLFIFWLFCLCCQWDDKLTIWQKLISKKGIAIISIFATIGLLLFGLEIGYKIKRIYVLDKSCPSCPPISQINWEQKYNEEVAEKEAVLKKYPRIKKYFK